MAIVRDSHHSVDSKTVSAIAKPLTAVDVSIEVWLDGAPTPFQLRFSSIALRDAFYADLDDALV